MINKSNAITVKKDNRRVNIRFEGFVCWEGNGDKIVEIQTCLEDENIDFINLEFNDVVWMDGLILCQLCLYLKKASDSHKEVEIYLFDRDNIEHARFVNYLMDAGFINFFESILKGCEYDAKEYLSKLDMVKLNEGNFDSAETILPFRVIEKEQEANDIIEESMRMLSERNLESNTVTFRLKLFLQEVLGNVYEHAYNEGETAYCGVLIRRKYQEIEKKSKIRDYDSNLALSGKVNFSKYRSFIFSNNKYKIKNMDDVRADYIQVHVVDIGNGILSGFENAKPQEEFEIFSKIFSSGKRVNKKHKNTQVGGLNMIHNIFGKNADALGIKGDYHLYPIECEREDWGKVDKAQLYFNNYNQNQIIRGFSVVGYLNIIGNITKQYRKYFKSANQKIIRQVYKNHKPILLDDTTKIIDYRFEKKEEYQFEDTVKNVVILVSRELAKNRLTKLFYDNLNILGTLEIENLIVADFVDYEISKYYLIFSKMKIKAKRVILISRSYSAAVFTQDTRDGEIRVYHNTTETRQYLAIQEKQGSIFKSVYNYIHWLIGYESDLFWRFLNEYQVKSNQKVYLKEKIEWNYETNKYMRSYLDFSQASFIRECRELFILQLFRLISLFGRRIYFESGDRFTEDICELANAELGANAEQTHIFIGSAYVTGTSSLKQNIEQKELDDKWFYFFKHADSEAKEQIETLLEWEKTIEELEDKKTANYSRIEETPFIAQNGTSFFRGRALKNEENKIVKMSSKMVYEYLQDPNVWVDNICGLAHVDLVGPHDNILFNMVEMLKKDRMDSYTQPRVLNTSYDFLLFHFYDALGVNTVSNLETSIETDIRQETVSYSATKQKILMFARENSNYFKKNKGILLYFTDYATTKIVGFYQEIFSSDLNYRIIPIALVNRERGAAALLISPLLVESLEELLKVYKDEGNTARITIFSSMLISTKLIDELKHTMYRIGADEVKLLSMIDRRRMPFGYSEKEEITTFWKMDIPPLGNDRNCAICQGLANLERLKKELGIDDLCNRIDEISSMWRCRRSFENKLAVIKRKYIHIPNEIKAVIANQIESKYYMNGIEITTDIGLVLFAVEDTAVTRSLTILEKCLEADLQDDTKMLLLCAYLGLFRKVEISEKKRFALSRELYRYVKRQDSTSVYSSLALIVLAAQEDKIINGLKKESSEDIYIQRNYKNTDALISGIFINWYKEKSIDIKIQYYFKGASATLPELLNAIFQYTCKRCRTTHSGILTRLYEEGKVFKMEDYVEAYYRIKYLKDIYDKFPEVIVCDLTQGKEFLDEIRAKVSTEEVILRKYIESPNETLQVQILECNRVFINSAENLNSLLFKASSENLIPDDLKDIKKEIMSKQSEIDVLETLKDVLIEWPTKGSEYECWYYWTNDIIEEISYLMLDFRYLKEKMWHRDPKTFERKEVTAVVEAVFTDSCMEMHFKNKISPDDSIVKLRETKKLKYNRPSILRMRELMKAIVDVDLFSYETLEEDKELILDVCLRIPYIYKRKE